MKKKYISPTTEIIDSEFLDVVCASKKYSVNTGAQWGGEGEYAPGEWINQGYGGSDTGGYTTSPIEDTEDDIPSRGKEWGDLWDDVIW